MKCPYCTSDISREALVCPVCRRDLYLFKPLLARIADLEEQLRQSRASRPESSELQESIGVSETGAGGAAPAAGTAPSPAGLGAWLLYWGLPLLLLLAAHGLIVLVFDLDTLYLRIVSLLIPLPFGFLLLQRSPNLLWQASGAAFAMAALAVLGMSGLVAYVDGVPWLPQGRGEWREFAEYSASVGFSYLTGMLFGRMLACRPVAVPMEEGRGGWKMVLARRMVSGPPSMEKLQAAIARINEVSNSLVAIGTTVLSIYTGLKGLLG